MVVPCRPMKRPRSSAWRVARIRPFVLLDLDLGVEGQGLVDVLEQIADAVGG